MIYYKLNEKPTSCNSCPLSFENVCDPLHRCANMSGIDVTEPLPDEGISFDSVLVST